MHRKPAGADAASVDLGAAAAIGRGFASHVAAPAAAAAGARTSTPASFTIAAAGLQDYVLSPDGHTIYIAGADGTIRSYDAASRVQTGAWHVGTDLGGIDISVDGKTIVAVEDLTAFSKRGTSSGGLTSYQAYTLDLATGTVAAHLTSDGDTYPQGFFDITTTSDGKAILSGDDQWGSLTVLDLATGVYPGTQTFLYTSTLRASTSHEHVVVLENGISDAPVNIYTPGRGITATHGGYDDGVQGYNDGVVAIDDTRELVAQGLGSGVEIYDLRLNFQFKLNTYKALGLGQVSGLAFSANGATLYVLDSAHDTIVAVGTKVWEPTASYALGNVDIVGDRYGNGLVASADGTYLTFVAADGLHIVDLSKGAGMLSGTDGPDALAGGAGNDIYVVDNAGDSVTEASDAGYDIVRASVRYTLSANVEGLELTGDATGGTGNALANTLTGNEHANRLAGLGGSDSLTGGAGDDTLAGGGGNDVLDGGAGDDAMNGGRGDDRYIVDSAADTVVEGARGGDDTVEASVTTVLANGVETLMLTGNGTISGTGNAGDNHLLGNAADNILRGLDGDDLLEAGGGGADRLLGGAGADTFRFVQLDPSGASYTLADSIGDFSTVDGDKIDLSGMDANVAVAADQAFSFIGRAAFSGTAGELQTLSYQGDTYLQADVNGDKLIDFVVVLDGKVAVTAADFFL